MSTKSTIHYIESPIDWHLYQDTTTGGVRLEIDDKEIIGEMEVHTEREVEILIKLTEIIMSLFPKGVV